MAKKSTTFESDIFDANETNLVEKLKPHFSDVIRELKNSKLINAKLITRIKELTVDQSLVLTDIEDEQLNSLFKKE